MYTLLVIDDSWLFRKMISRNLAQVGYRVLCAEDTVAGWELLEQEVPDLLLLDITLPKISGIEFLKILRELPAWCDLPVLILSGDSDRDTVLAAARLGACGYVLKKKCRGSELEKRVSTVLNRLPRQLAC